MPRNSRRDERGESTERAGHSRSAGAEEKSLQPIFPPVMEMLVRSPSRLPQPAFLFSTHYEKELMQRTLELPEILEVIMKNLDMKTLLICRIVRSIWSNEANRILKNKFTILGLQELDVLNDLRVTINAGIDGVSLPIQKLQFRDRIPLKTVQKRLNPVKHQVKALEWVTHDTLQSFNEMMQLLHNFFPNVEKLEISIYRNFLYMEESPDLKNKMLPYAQSTLPQLKEITIDVTHSGINMRSISNFLKALLSSATNLESLRLSTWFTELIKAEDVISSVSSSKMQNLKMGIRWTSSVENMKALSNLAVPLTTIQLQIDINTVDLKPLLVRCSSSLMELYLHLTESHAYYEFPLGVYMRKLWKLKLKYAGDKFCIDWSRTPRIKNLELHNCSLQGIVTSLFNYPRHCTQLQTLEFLTCGYYAGHLEAFYPLLKQLVLRLNSQLTRLQLAIDWNFEPPLALIFEECARLIYLDLRTEDRKRIDNGMCGVREVEALTVIWPEEKVDRLEVRDTHLDAAYHDLLFKVKTKYILPYREYPFIGVLSELLVLVLHGHFSELAILHGIIHCKNLKRLELQSSETQMNRERAIRIIRQAGLLHLTNLKVNGLNVAVNR